MSVLALQETIASLIDLAERGAIDPWDVRVVEVLDRYFQALQTTIEPLPRQLGQTLYDVHLSQSAQAFLSAAMLVLLKANHLTAAEFPPVDLVDDLAAADFADLSQLAPRRLPKRLEDWIVRRGVAQPPSQRRVSLQEMINQLQAVAETLADRPARSRPGRKPSRGQKIRAIRQLAHHENLEEVAAALDAFLRSRVQPNVRSAWPTDPAVASHHPTWTFDDLVATLPRSGPRAVPLAHPHAENPQKSDRAATFWALLLLASQSKVELEQTEFYGELFVRSIDLPDQMPNSPTATPQTQNANPGPLQANQLNLL